MDNLLRNLANTAGIFSEALCCNWLLVATLVATVAVVLTDTLSEV